LSFWPSALLRKGICVFGHFGLSRLLGHLCFVEMTNDFAHF
jgi:hypothetical protein